MTSKVELTLLDRHNVYNTLKDGFRFTFDAALAKDNNYTLFRYEDWQAWVIFSTVFLVLIIFDNVILHRNPYALTVGRAVAYTLFWMVAACGFCGWVFWWYGESSAYMWMSGYMLEWMLSFDNLFVFHLIFSVYGTPDDLKHRPLYLGILGAVVFRLAFIFIGEYLMHAMTLMHLVFGAFLVYTGIKTVSADEEDEDPSQNPVVVWLQRSVPFVSVYCSKGSFFVNVPVNSDGEAHIPEEAKVKPEAKETDRILETGDDDTTKFGVVDFSRISAGQRRMEMRATMLFLVVCCLEISDLLFAVDSVSAIVAQVNDLFLAYTSAVFAMLGLRATFFIIDVLVQLFSLLKYGVAIVLVFIGIKLIIGKFYHVPASIVCVVLVGAIAGSMLASVIQDKLQKKFEGKLSPEIAERIAKIRNSPFASPAVTLKKPM
jgi:tellurite resistance protein TerC|mmetsp:Transcript_83018/g.130965  ORF Transcript_83018/g.130965 Transcript_83018/m.130965 type:complete len:430 (-) Transcript_83018:61-1350(-)